MLPWYVSFVYAKSCRLLASNHSLCLWRANRPSPKSQPSFPWPDFAAVVFACVPSPLGRGEEMPQAWTQGWNRRKASPSTDSSLKECSGSLAPQRPRNKSSYSLILQPRAFKMGIKPHMQPKLICFASKGVMQPNHMITGHFPFSEAKKAHCSQVASSPPWKSPGRCQHPAPPEPLGSDHAAAAAEAAAAVTAWPMCGVGRLQHSAMIDMVRKTPNEQTHARPYFAESLLAS